MKKIIVLLCLLSLGFSAVRLQGQANTLGYGLGVGLGARVIPMLLEMGIEGSTHAWPAIKNKGTYEGQDYDGEFKSSATRAGGYVKVNIPVINMIPVLSFFAHPTLHAGAQSGYVDADGCVRLAGVGNVFADKVNLQGSYALLGFPNYIGPFFIEPAIGTQHIAIPGVVNLENIYDAQIALGLSF